MDIFIQQIINGLVLGSMYALVALGYTMVYGIIGLINFAHGDVLMVGALSTLAQQPPVGTADHGHWYVDLVAGRGHDHLETQLQVIPCFAVDHTV